MAVYEGIGSFLKGQAGDWSFFDRNRRTIARQKKNRVGKPKRTKKNMRIKTALANNVNAWRACQGALKKSFEIEKPGETCYNKFMSLGLQGQRIYLTKLEAEMGACVLVNFMVSMGSLQPVVSVTKRGNKLVSNIKVGNLTIDENTTVGQFSEAVMNNNRFQQRRCYHQNDVINFVRFYQNLEPGSDMPFVEVDSANVTLTTAVEQGSSMKLLELVGDDGFDVVDGFLAANVVEHTMLAWIHSRLEDNELKQVTSQRLVGDNEEMIAAYSSEQAFTKAAESYGKFNDEDNFRPSDNGYFDNEEPDGEPTGPDPTPETATVTFQISEADGGVVKVGEQTYRNGDTAQFPIGQQVTFLAVANPTYTFGGWNGAGGSDTSLTMTIEGATTIQARFNA